jgi:hypothetical protein
MQSHPWLKVLIEHRRIARSNTAVGQTKNQRVQEVHFHQTKKIKVAMIGSKNKVKSKSNLHFAFSSPTSQNQSETYHTMLFEGQPKSLRTSPESHQTSEYERDFLAEYQPQRFSETKGHEERQKAQAH